MNILIGVLLLLLPINGCANNDKILDSQEKTDAKIDSLLTLLTAPDPMSRKDRIISRFDSLVAYHYGDAQVPTSATADEEHEYIPVRYAEYWVFFASESESYNGDYEFVSHILPSGYRKIKEFVPDYGPDPFDRLTTPDIYQSSGKWRILNEREIDLYREAAVFFSFRDRTWYNLPAVILGANVFSLHDTKTPKLMLGSLDGGSEFFSVTSFFNLTSVKNGIFDF